jgi:type I restriction enzyme S subunit
MNNWEKVLSKSVLDIRDGTHDSPKYHEQGFPLLTSKNLKNGSIDLSEVNFISFEDFESINKRSKVNIGDILYSMIGSIGNFALITSEPNFAIKNVALFRFVDNRLYNKFFIHLLQSDTINRQIEKSMKGGTQKFVSLGVLRNLQIPLPPLAEQKRIAAILDAADLHRQKTNQLITKYDDLSQSLFLDMFGDPVTNPKGWELKSLKSLSTKIGSGNTPKGGSSVYVDNGITFFRSQNVWKNNLIYDDIAYIDLETHKKMQRSSLKYGDLLMTKTGRFNTENSSLGRAAIYLGDDDMANVNGHVYLIRLKKGQVNKFILHILTSIQFRDLIRRVCVGGIDKRQLNKNHIEDFPIVTPPKILQEKFMNQLESIEEQKSQAEASLQRAEDLFQSLLQKAFKGEL